MIHSINPIVETLHPPWSATIKRNKARGRVEGTRINAL